MKKIVQIRRLFNLQMKQSIYLLFLYKYFVSKPVTMNIEKKEDYFSVKPGAELNDEQVQALFEEYCRQDTIPVVFKWAQGGRKVFLSGTFSEWVEKSEMKVSGNEFLVIHNLERKKYAYKFIVDDEWCFSSDDPTVADKEGYVNNMIDLTTFKEEFNDLSKPIYSVEEEFENERFSQVYHPEDNLWGSKAPPNLPVHLREIVLNHNPTDDCYNLPRDVTLNHLYCSAIKDNLTVLATSSKTSDGKYVHTLSYRPQGLD